MAANWMSFVESPQWVDTVEELGSTLDDANFQQY
jgi:hypothetical protein